MLQINFTAQTPQLDSLKHVVEKYGNAKTEAAMEARLSYAIKLARIDAKSSDSVLKKLEILSESKHSLVFWGRLLSLEADLKEEAGHRIEATRLYQKVYQLGDSLHSDRLLKLAFTGLGSLEIPNGDMNRGISFCHRAIEVVQRMKPVSDIDMGKLHYNIGLAHSYQEQLDSASWHFEKAIEFANKIQKFNLLAINYSGLSMVAFKKGNVKQALQMVQKALSFQKKGGDNRQMIGTLVTIGNCHLDLGQHQMAEENFRKALALSIKTNSATTRINVLSNLSLSLEKQNKWQEAYRILEEAYLLKDTIFDAQTEETKLALEASFDSKLREKDIKLLKQQKENQALVLKRQRLFNWGLGGLGFMALALAFVFYRNAQLRKKTNELLKMEKTMEQGIRLRLEKENKNLLEENLKTQFEMLKSQVNPHFLFNSLNSLSSLIRLDAERAEMFVEELSSVYRYLLKSNENQLISLKEELEFIQSYVHLLKTRFGEALQVHLDVAEKVLEMKIPPLTLQLLVENAIKHNIVSLESPLHLHIKALGDDSILVENNLQRKYQGVISHKVGISNIVSKYELLQLPLPKVGEDGERFWVRLALR